jgi:transcriptional regulator with XRE-family HTH domain
MPESFGARLRQRRERQQISLTTIAEQTKTQLSLLEALERDDVSHWPAGTFRRAFIRAYTHAIGPSPTSSSASSWNAILIRLKLSRRCRLSRQGSMVHR